ncbi:MAG: hypothetical protein HYY18_05290 [Planctomycetes bacterium]|nr:hypothetical protein [Planctomycetota bacterium]
MKSLAAAALTLALAALPARAQEESLKDGDVKDLQKIVEGIRTLKFKNPVKVGVQDEKDLKAMVRKSFDEEFPEAKARKVEAAYKKLGVIPKDMNLREFMIELLADSIGGYYDPKTKQLYLIRRTGGGNNQLNETMKQMYGMDWDTMATIHELTHALQDQHFDLQSIPTDMEGNDDLVTAMQCLFEGEANYVMYENVFAKRGTSLRTLPSLRMFLAGGVSGSPKMNAAPEILKRGLAFPYMEGMVFVHAVLKKGAAWETVEEMYTKLPLSTEQILHPEKYLEKDYPQEVKLPDLGAVLGKGWERVEENALGELNIQIVLGEFISRKKSAKTINAAAAGWDGDRFAVYMKGDEAVLVWFSTWDTEGDAGEFAKQAVRALKKKLGAEGAADGDARTAWDGGSSVERHGRDVLWIETAGKAAGKVSSTVWAGVELKELTKIERKPKKDANAMAENEVFALRKAPRGVNWKVVEDGTSVTVTWKGMDGAATFRCVSKKGREKEEVLEEALAAAKGELEGGKRRSWTLESLEAPAGALTGKSGDLGDVKVGIVVLAAKKKYVIARLACSKKDWEKASAVFEKLLAGYEPK